MMLVALESGKKRIFSAILSPVVDKICLLVDRTCWICEHLSVLARGLGKGFLISTDYIIRF